MISDKFLVHSLDFFVESIEFFIGNAHATHHFVHLRHANLFGTSDAQTFIMSFTILHLCDEYHGKTFFTSGTKCGLHIWNTSILG